jgi:hypothetical protein
MATNFLWGAVGSVYNLLTTEINALASGSGTALGPEIDNTTNAFQVGKLHLHIASNSLALVAGSYCKVFLLSSNAGATYPTYTSGTSYALSEPNYLVGVLALNPKTQSSNVVDEWLEGVFIPAGKFKAALVYVGGGAGTLPATGNTLDLFPTPSQY